MPKRRSRNKKSTGNILKYLFFGFIVFVFLLVGFVTIRNIIQASQGRQVVTITDEDLNWIIEERGLSRSQFYALFSNTNRPITVDVWLGEGNPQGTPGQADIENRTLRINPDANWAAFDFVEVVRHEALHPDGYLAVFNAEMQEGNTLIECIGSLCRARINEQELTARNWSEGTVSEAVGGGWELQQTLIRNLSAAFNISDREIERMEREEGLLGWCELIRTEWELQEIGNCTADMIWQMAQFPSSGAGDAERVDIEAFKATFTSWLETLGQGPQLDAPQ